jgi:hypothetical protein
LGDLVGAILLAKQRAKDIDTVIAELEWRQSGMTELGPVPPPNNFPPPGTKRLIYGIVVLVIGGVGGQALIGSGGDELPSPQPTPGANPRPCPTPSPYSSNPPGGTYVC